MYEMEAPSGVSAADATSTADKIEMSITEILAIARKMDGVKDTADTKHKNFKNVSIPEGALGPTEQGAGFLRQHKGAHQTYVETIGGLISDLQLFADNLRKSANGMNEADTASSDGLKRVQQALPTWQTRQVYDESRGKYAEDLRTPEGAREAAEAREQRQDQPVPAPETPELQFPTTTAITPDPLGLDADSSGGATVDPSDDTNAGFDNPVE